MGNLDSTLGDIKRLEKAAGAEDDPIVFSPEGIKKFNEASAIFKTALEEIDKVQSQEVMKTTHGQAIATARAAILNLEGTMSLIWEENGMNDVIRGQFQNVIGLLQPMTSSVAKNAGDKPAAEPVAEPAAEPVADPAADDKPAADATTPTAKTAAEEADEKNKPEGHSEGSGGDPANPEDVVWPRDLNTEEFRKNEHKEPKPSWGEDPKPTV